MTYSLKPQITIQGITIQAVCRTVGTTVIRGNSVVVSRQVTPVAIIFQDQGNVTAATLDGKPMSPRILEAVRHEISEIHDVFM